MHPETPLPLTLEEHRDLGNELRAATARLRPLCDLVVTVYGPQNRAAASFLRTMEALERLEADLATQSTLDAL